MEWSRLGIGASLGMIVGITLVIWVGSTDLSVNVTLLFLSVGIGALFGRVIGHFLS